MKQSTRSWDKMSVWAYILNVFVVGVMFLALVAAIVLPFYFDEPVKDPELRRWIQCFRTTSECPRMGKH